MKKQKNKVKWLHSIKTRIIALVIVAALVVGGICSWFLLSQTKKFIEEAYGTILIQTASGHAGRVDDVIRKSASGSISMQEYNKIFKGLQIEGIENTGYAIIDAECKYVISSGSGKMGTTASGISQYADAVAKIADGSFESLEVKDFFDEEGNHNLYCLAKASKANELIVIYFSYDVISDSIAQMIRTAAIGIAVIVVILVAAAFLLSSSITKPIRKISKVVSKNARLEFERDTQVERLAKNMDETGEMARAIEAMQSNLRNVVEHITQVSNNLEENSGNLHIAASQINNASTDNSATAEELAASMQETAATVETIDSNTIEIKGHAGNIASRATEGVNLASEIRKRASNLHTSALTSSQETRDIYESVKVKSEEAMKQSKAVEKVNALATTIQDIADQTSLLSLNASIEAARAGELGKGFAVVADEIGHLAQESTATVKGIMSIVTEVNAAVKNMGDCLVTTLQFLDGKVMGDYQSFVEVSNQYDSDAQAVSNSMDEIYQLVSALQAATDEIVVSISGISATVNEAAQGVNDVADKTSEVVNMSTKVVGVVESTSECSGQLKEVAEAFHM